MKRDLTVRAYTSGGQLVTKHKAPYEFPTCDPEQHTQATIWSLHDAHRSGINVSVTVNDMEFQFNKTSDELAYMAGSAAHDFGEATLVGRPLSSAIRLLHYKNDDPIEKQCMPYHHDFCVTTIRLFEAVFYANELHRISTGPKQHKGVFHKDFVAGRNKHAAFCPGKAERIYCVLFIYPGTNYEDVKMTKQHLKNVACSSHSRVMEKLDEYSTPTYGDYYRELFKSGMARA